jgi:hypothetical protein
MVIVDLSDLLLVGALNERQCGRSRRFAGFRISRHFERGDYCLFDG